MTGPRPRLSDVLGRPARPSLRAALSGGPRLDIQPADPVPEIPVGRGTWRNPDEATVADAGRRTVAPQGPPLLSDAPPPRPGDPGARDATAVPQRAPRGLPDFERLTQEPEPVPAFGKGGTFGPGGPVNTAAGAGLRVAQFIPSQTIPASVALAVGEALQGEYLAAGLDATLGAALPWALRARKLAKADRFRRALEESTVIEPRPVPTPVTRVTMPDVLPEEMTPAQADLNRAVAAGQRVDDLRARFGSTLDAEVEVQSINERIASALAPEAVPPAAPKVAPKRARVPRRTDVSALEVPRMTSADLPRNLANASTPDLLAYLDHLDGQIDAAVSHGFGQTATTRAGRNAQKFSAIQSAQLQGALGRVEEALAAKGIDVEGHRIARFERAAIQSEAGEAASDRALSGMGVERNVARRARQQPSDVPFSPRVGNERGALGQPDMFGAGPENLFDDAAVGGRAVGAPQGMTEAMARARSVVADPKEAFLAKQGRPSRAYTEAQALLARGSAIGADELGARLPDLRSERGMVGPRPQTDTPEFKNWFGRSRVVDDAGEPIVVYHGTSRPDRIGSVFRRSRATSGPMAMFTDDPAIASKYAVGKADTSLEAPASYDGWFSYKPKGARSTVDIGRAWWHLAPEERARIAELAPRVTTNDAGDVVLAEAGHTRGLGGYDQHLKEARGNHLKALVEEWLSSGQLFDSEEEFLGVLKMAGMRGVEFTSPHATAPAVYPVHLAIERPLVTSAIPDDVVDALEAASRRQPMPRSTVGADMWDKRIRDPREWIASLKKDRANGENSFVWSSIPDWVTRTLRRFGYDGIHDTGGKMGGIGHSVWIPFDESQVKSAIGNRGTFSRDTKNITGAGALKYLTGLTGAGAGGTAGAATIEPDDSPAEKAAKIAAGTVIGGVLGVKGGQAIESASMKLGTRGTAPPAIEPIAARKPSPVTPVDDALRQGPLRKPEANTVRRLDLPDDLAQRVASMAREYEGPGYESHAQVRAAAERLLATRDAPVDFTRGTRQEVLAAAAMLRQNTDEAGKLAQRLADPTLTATERADAAQSLGYLESQSRTLLNSITRAKTNQARDLAANRILANLTATPEHWQYRAQQVAERPLSDLEAAEIRRLLDAGKRDEMLRFVGGLRPTTLGEKIVTFWKSGLLTNPATHAANISSNTMFQLTEEAARTPSAFWDWLISKTTAEGIRTKTPTNAAILRASARGAWNGIREMPKRLRGLPTGDDLALGEIPLVTDMGHPLLTTAVSTPFRFLDAADRPFFQAALQGSLAEQATILGQAERLTGKALKARVAALVKSPTDDMAARALHDAAVRTFRDETALGGFLGDVGKRFGPAGQLVVPFSRTPGAVATRFAEYTPFGFARGASLWRQAVKESTMGVEGAAATQQKAAEVLGRATVGLGPLMLGALMYRQGTASGQVDVGDATGRATRRMLNIPNDGFKIGGQWIEPNRLGPVGMLMSLGAVMAQQAESEGSALARAGQGAFAAARTVTDQPFLQGIEQLQRARESTEGAGQYAAKLGASAVPAGVAALARAVDPVEREAKTFGEQVQARIPWWSKSLPPRRTQLGDEKERMGPGAQALFSPVRVTPQANTLDDQLLAEVARTGAQLSQPKRLDGETGEAYSERVRVAGEQIRRRLLGLVSSDRYQRMPPAGLVRQRPQWAGLTGDALQRAYQAELIEDLTRQVRGSETRRARYLQQQEQARD